MCQQRPPSCRLVNRSGLRLSYWTDDVGEDGEVGCAYTLNAWEESPLLVDPVERTVIIPDTQQQASCHHPGQCLQFSKPQITYADKSADLHCLWCSLQQSDSAQHSTPHRQVNMVHTLREHLLDSLF